MQGCIEISMVMHEPKTLQVVVGFNTFIKPQRHLQLTPFCTNTSGITQADVNTAPCYPEDDNAFTAWLQNYDSFLFCLLGVGKPIAAPHLNIKKKTLF